MRQVQSTQRRRRLRLIQAEDKRTQRFHKAASALAVAADTEAARIEAEALQQHLALECRAKSRTRLRVEHPGVAPLMVTMVRPFLLIGSDPACDLTLDHEEVAPHHCFLQWVDGQIFCCDISPRPNNIPIRRQPAIGRWLNQEPIEIGPYLLRLDTNASAPDLDYSPLDRSQRLLSDFPQLALQFQGVEQSDNQWPVNRVLTMVGQGVQCKLRLNHPSMANVQAALLRTQKSCWLIDVAGTGTTGVNGRTIRVASVDVGDKVHLGPFQVEVVTTVFDPVDPTPVSRKRATGAVTSSPHALVETPSHRKQETADPVSQHSTGPSPELAPGAAPFRDHFAGESQVGAASPSHLDAADSLIRSAADVEVNHLESKFEPAARVTSDNDSGEESTAASSRISLPSDLIAEFVKTQQSQLSQLKSSLDRLKSSCDDASKRASAKRLKNILIKSVTETLQTQVEMSQSLVKLIEAIEIDQ